MAELKNQDYVPKVLLSRFTNPDRTTTNLFNVHTNNIRTSIPYKPQCSIDYFYGKDLEIEKRLGILENRVGSILNVIEARPETYIKPYSEEHVLLTIFSLYQYVRTLKTLETVKSVVSLASDEIKKQTRQDIMPKLLEAANGKATKEQVEEFFDSMTLSLAKPHFAIFSIADKEIEPTLRLRMKIIQNKTTKPFIISDNPLVYMHQQDTDCFYRMLLPLTPKLALVFYDNKKYKIGEKHSTTHELHNDKDVFHLNSLQYMNSKTNLYFNSSLNLKDLQSYSRTFRNDRINNPITPTLQQGSPFLKSNRPKSGHSFSFVKKI